MLSILHSLDIYLLELVNLSFHNFILDHLALYISYGGIIYFWIIIIILLYLLGGKKGKDVAKRMLIVLIITTLITQVVKYVVMRPRPYTELSSLILLGLGTDPSFPSGHTSTSTAMSWVLSKEYNWIFMLIPIFVALSRLYIGVHYPSDVMGGFLLGLGVAYLVERYINCKILNIK